MRKDCGVSAPAGGANFRAIQSIGAIGNKEFPRVKLQVRTETPRVCTILY
jgi:hypothetical protein